MKKLFKTSFIFLALLGVLFTSCKKDYEIPPIPVLPEGQVYTIAELLAMPANTSFDTASVYGIVTADEQSGNLYKTIFIQDRATGKAIELLMNTSSAARIGDSVRVFLDKNIMVNNYHNLPQLVGKDGKGFNPDGHLVIYPFNKPIEPATVTIADIKTGNYIAGLVRLENVEFAEQGSAFCNVGENTNRTLKDATGELLVRTSNYANFAYDLLPVGQGNLVAIASVYNNDWQLILRSTHSKDDFDFEGGEPTPPTPPGELQQMPYTQSFATDFGTYSTYDVLGPQRWTIDYSCAVMKGYDGGNFANEDWLISSPVAVTGVDSAKVAVTYVAQYQNSDVYDVTLQVSTDYVYGNAPNSANWTQMETTYPNTGGWSDFQTVETSLNDFIGQNITVAIKFTSSETQSRTLEVQSITVQEGYAGGGVTPPTPGVGEGSGTAEDPYNVAAGIANQGSNQGSAPTAWVQGYIVGAVKNGTSQVSGNGDVIWNAPFDSYTNVVIADDPNCNEIALCVIVNLPAGKPLRTQVNLVDNPDNMGKMLAVNGKLYPYFGKAGLRESGGTENDFVLEGGTPPTPPTQQYLNETLLTQSSFDNFTPYSVLGEQAWAFDERYGAKMSGYEDNTSYANKDWFISPAIDLSSSTAPVLVFDHARGPESSMNIGVEEGYYTVWVCSDYEPGTTPDNCNWVQLEGVIHPTVKWTYVSSGELLIPAELRTANTRFGFLYLSADGASATWEIKNVIVKEQ